MRIRHYRADVGELAAAVLKSFRLWWPAALVGSFRRETETVGDLDIMVRRLDLSLFLLRNRYQAVLLSNPDTVKTRGRAQIGDLKIDLFGCRLESWGAGMILTTGPANFSIAMAARAKSMGMVLRMSGLKDMGGVVGGRTEHEVFEILDMDYIPPTERGKVPVPKYTKAPGRFSADERS